MTRHSTTAMTFRRPFSLGDHGEVLPAGAYAVETDEELLEGVSFPVYRRIMTLLHVPATAKSPGVHRTLMVDPIELEAALQRDLAPAEGLADQAISDLPCGD